MRTVWLAVIAVAVVGAKLAGVYTFGFVGSGSMEPTMPEGSLFVAFNGRATIGDVVVFEAPSGDLIVHRVVGVGADGWLVTQGDANADNDVQSGLGPVNPADVQVVPQAGGGPLHVSAAWMRPASVVALQVVVLAIGIRGVLRAKPGRRASSVRAHHVLLAASALLLITAPLYHDAVEVGREVGVRASLIPIVARVATPVEESLVNIGPMQEAVMPAAGAVSVVYAPDLPGAGWLTQFGATAAVLPAVLLGVAGALVLRVKGA